MTSNSCSKTMKNMPRTYIKIKDRVFEHTRAYDATFLVNTGMAHDFQTVLWAEKTSRKFMNNAHISLLLSFYACSKLLLWALHFDFLGEDHSINWNNLRMMIGFNSKCLIGLDSVVPTFNKNAFPLKISRQTDSTLPRTNDIHNPTLWFMHHRLQ